MSEHKHITDWRTLIERTTVSDLVSLKERSLIVLSADNTLGEVINLLANENILSAPVIDLNGTTILGLVDVIDIAGFILHRWRERSGLYLSEHFPSDEIYSMPITDVLNFSSFNPMILINGSDSVADLIKLFTAPRTFNRLHRVLVLEENGNVVNMVSQSDVVMFASDNRRLLPDHLLNMNLNELNAIHPVITVRIDTSFIDALELLYQNRISGLAIVDENYHLDGNLSCSDLRGMHFRSFDFFLGSVLQFQAKGTKTRARPIITCSQSATFGEVILEMTQNGVHRLYVRDAYNRPIGIVSLSDVICRLNEH